MKKWIIVGALSLIFVVGLFGSALAQSAVDWEHECLSGRVELDLLESGSVLVRCFLGDVAPTETATLEPTETATPEPTVTPGPTATLAPSSGIVVDHASIELFDRIPQEFLQAAKDLPMMFSDRSVGVNMNESLNCLAAPSWAQSPSYCRRDYTDASQTTVRTYNATDFANGNVPELILFPAGDAYSRANWSYTDCQGSWDVMTELFIDVVAPEYLATKDVLSCQFSYLNVGAGSTIDDPVVGYFATDVHLVEDFASANPDKTIVFWTSSLARTNGSPDATNFNNQMRAYAADNDVVLMDMADIISHDRNGNPCYLPGTNYPVICRDYTTEANGGHLGSVSGGRIQMAKAFWVLMAQIAGWTP